MVEPVNFPPLLHLVQIRDMKTFFQPIGFKLIIPILLIIVLITSSFVLGGHDNVSNSTSDFRDQYLGTYACYGSCNDVFRDGQKILRKKKTETINIIITKDVQDSILQFKIGNNLFKARISSGKFIGVWPTNHFGGEFLSTGRVSFRYSLGRNYSCKFKGIIDEE